MSVLGFNAADLGTMLDSLLDPTMARPIKVFVDRQKGHIWRLIDPLSPTENMPVIVEWTKERNYKVKVQGEPTETTKTRQRQIPERTIRLGTLVDTIEDASFKFDQPRVGEPNPISAFNSPAEIQRIRDFVRRETQEGGHGDLSLWFLMFGNADMVGREAYNHGLSQRRDAAVGAAIRQEGASLMQVNGAEGIACSEFNTRGGPNIHERNNSSPGNPYNRRVHVFAIRDRSNQPKLKEKLNSVRDGLLTNLNSLKDPAEQLSPTELAELSGRWRRDSFPCPAQSSGIRTCQLLSCKKPGDDGHKRPYCPFYEQFKTAIETEIITVEPGRTETEEYKETTPGQEREVQKTEIYDKYTPPPGEHYGFNLRHLMDLGINVAPGFPPEVAVAPNRQEDTDDFNLIKAGPIKVVKLDVGFWGDERKADTSRKAGFRREPARPVGVIEGPFVWLCEFQTRDSVGDSSSFDSSPEKVDERLNPLFHRFVQAVSAAGHKIKILKKAVAEAGPDESKLLLFFGDMHLPRKLDEKDAEYSEDECIKSKQMLKSLVLDTLRQDYRLRATQTPWLSAHDRKLCTDFFEHRAPKLKLPHYSSGRTISNPFDPEGENWLAKAGDAVKKTMQVLTQAGYYLFEFTQDDRRREVKRGLGQYADRGRGRTKEGLSNWFYGFETDRNVFEPGSGQKKPDPTQLIPGPAKEILERATILDGPDKGKKPAEEKWDDVNAGPARDLLRLLKVVSDQRSEHDKYVEVYHTGDMFEMWANMRYLMEDFTINTAPEAQLPEAITGVVEKLAFGQSGSALRSLGDGLKGMLRAVLANFNAGDVDLWHRREAKRDLPSGPLPQETSYTLTGAPDGTIFGPGGPSVSVPYDQTTSNLTKETTRGAGYISAETKSRENQILAFEAPLREDASGQQEDNELLGGAKRGNMGRWNEAVVKAFKNVGATLVYGNHDCFRGLHGGDANGFHTGKAIWAEHGHRFEDSNVDGQPFGSFVTNLCFEYMEIALYEGLLEEFTWHREQNLYQPGIMLWFLIAEFMQDSEQLQQARERGERINPFRIAVVGHTHQPDLVVAEIVFRAKEKTNLADLNTWAAAAKLAATLIPKIIKLFADWYERYSGDGGGWSKWWDDMKDEAGEFFKGIGGRTEDWATGLFGGWDDCLDKAGDFLKKTGQDVRKKLEQEAGYAQQRVDDARRNLPGG
ncbi:MAG: hypothetical protein KKB50_05120 [Planctomycetes bacterium]|nr:hypothetical protein [Planctomycetota bacterium]